MQLRFENRTALVTGGSRGIGEAAVEALHAAGANVIATATGADAVAKLNEERGGERLTYVALDFRDEASVTKAFGEFKELRRIDVLVNNAGINKINPITEMDDDDWDRIYTVNLEGVYRLTKLAAKKMSAQKYGRIVNISSIFGVVSKEQRSAYSATKFGLLGFTKGIALDLAPAGVLVNCLAPGFVDTELTRSVLGDEGMAQMAAQVPLGRLAQPTEIADAILFLAHEKNSFITGQNIVIDGGFVSA